jgi:hypothetical protein
VVGCTGHAIRADRRVAATPVLGGLHHEYLLELVAARLPVETSWI